MSGFDRQLRDKILGFNAHLKIFHPQGAPMADYRAVMKAVTANKSVRAAAPFVMGQVLIKTEPESGNALVAGPYVRGIEPKFETNISNLATNIVMGTFDLEGDSVLVGSDLAANLGLRVGDRIVVYSPRNMEEMARQAGKSNSVIVLPPDFVVRGIYDVGYYEYNANWVVMSLENAQELYELDTSVHGLAVMLDDPMKAD
jgi:lipoprotein-releasing system permease protein